MAGLKMIKLFLLSRSVLKILRMKDCAIYYWVSKNKLFIINVCRLNLVYHLGLKFKENFQADEMSKLILKSNQV